MFSTLTKRQKEILDFINVFTQLNGFSPSLGDIKDHFRLSAISTVHEHIQNLKKKGYIQTEINQARSIRTIDPSLKNQHFVEIPIINQISKPGILQAISSKKTIPVHKDNLSAKGKYIGILVGDNSLEKSNIIMDDVLIVHETDTATNSTHFFIAKTPTKKVYIGKLQKVGSSHSLYPLNRKIETTV